MSARLTSALIVSALVRRTQQAGGAAIVVARGDQTAGAIILMLRDRTGFAGFHERVLGGDSRYVWTRTGPDNDESEEGQAWLARRRSRDTDVWIVELELADAATSAAIVDDL